MYKFVSKSILFFCVLLIVSGCSTKDYKLFQEKEKKDDSAEVVTMITDKEYAKEISFENTISPNDRVSIVVYIQAGVGSQQMSSILTSRNSNSVVKNQDDIGKLVTKEGKVRLPLIGSVKLLGLTEDEAADKIIKEYKKYIRNPYATVEIKNQRVVVIGEVRKPGIVPVTNGTMSIIEAIARSGDLTDFASRTNIKIIRGNLRNPQVRNLDLTDMVAINASSMYLKPNDIIYIQPRKLKGFNKAFNEINPFWNMLSSILDPLNQRKTLIQ